MVAPYEADHQLISLLEDGLVECIIAALQDSDIAAKRARHWASRTLAMWEVRIKKVGCGQNSWCRCGRRRGAPPPSPFSSM
jgi:hypothetical protein